MVELRKIITETALRTIRIESEAVAALAQGVNEDFIACVKRLHEFRGRVVLTGIGKSALIAQKIAATFNSTGTPALFMHAADAIHGDLGMIQPDDVVICLSKSGETPEIRLLVPLVKHMGNLLVAMVSRTDSYLARQADLILHTPIDQEADPNNLAPTASTTAQAAMGDALATCLLALRGFSPSDFAQFHPGGTLGKQLYLRVADLYPSNEKPQVHPDTPLHKTIIEMTSKRLGCAVVTDEQDQVLGIITDGDLRRMLEKEIQNGPVRADQIMSPHPKTISPEELAVGALELMRRNSITQLVVADGKTYLGIIHLHDLIREGLL
ncbi:MAG: KpsF/GutQ family sugar-phosphate isomerase [Saprospirales bacterium]|nr:KpsF/GutQ family sugar-phosphate isomerase [Saprospirales bacterium]